jgi:hypothetical protein
LFDRSGRFAHRDPQQNPDGDVHAQIEMLDRLFSRVATGGPHGQKQTFADWLQESAHPSGGCAGPYTHLV